MLRNFVISLILILVRFVFGAQESDDPRWNLNLVPNYPNGRLMNLSKKLIVNGKEQKQQMFGVEDKAKYVIPYYQRQMRYRKWKELAHRVYGSERFVVPSDAIAGLKTIHWLEYEKNGLYYNLQFLCYDRFTLGFFIRTDGPVLRITKLPKDNKDVPGSDPIDFIRDKSMQRLSSIIMYLENNTVNGIYVYASSADPYFLLNFYRSRMKDYAWHEDPAFRFDITQSQGVLFFVKKNASIRVIVKPSNDKDYNTSVVVEEIRLVR